MASYSESMDDEPAIDEAALRARGCGETVVTPDGEAVACNRHVRGWHFCRTVATWPELEDVCGSWGSTETAEGTIHVMCGRVPDHGDLVPHFATVGGFPKVWSD